MAVVKADRISAPSPVRVPGVRREFRFERDHFDRIAGLLYHLCGIHLAPHKQDMVYSRLVRRLRLLELSDFGAYCDLLESDLDGGEIGCLVNALTTNLTSFFREPHHFRHLTETALPQMRSGQTPRPRLRIWSAGCASGPEPYSIAMVLLSAVADLRRWDARILATDIDTQVIETARRGYYPIELGETIPPELRLRSTRRLRNPQGEQRLAMGDELRRLIVFKPLNLLEPWPMKGPFDVIFCRNVLIYFDRTVRKRIADGFTDLLTPGGFLYLGHSESLYGVTDRLVQTGPTIYRRNP
ncbi:MAG: chemotaxis protein [Azospirillum sp.]|nr:chemotaxis protein [Azospirillum sp.]